MIKTIENWRNVMKTIIKIQINDDFLLKKGKDITQKNNKTNCVYKIKCKDCTSCYLYISKIVVHVSC